MPRLRHTDDNSTAVAVAAATTEMTVTLQLDCWSDDLSPAQLAAYEKAEKERNDIRDKLDDIVLSGGGENVFLGEIFSAYTVPGTAPGIEDIGKPVAKVRREIIGQKKTEEKKQASRKREYKHVETNNSSSNSSNHHTNNFIDNNDDDDDEEYIPISKRALKMGKTLPAATTSDDNKGRKEKEKPDKHHDKKSSGGHRGKVSAIQEIHSTPTIPSTFRPTENTSIGGLSVGVIRKKDVVDLTKDDGITKAAADSREITFNKLQGKTYPSLVVVARPSLKVKDNVNDRSVLDTKVKSVLMHTATKFTEWLIQQGLVRSEQTCQIHPSYNLKLGMYSDATKFPYSGGYVWISECCPTRFVSVFGGSLFEGAPHPPSVLLKLIYHWSCQTNVQNVVQWVKVDNLYVKELYARLRSVCTVALHQHMNLLGGHGKKIEVGVISLGTTSQDGHQRQVKVEVLGVLDPESNIVRLRAVEPLNDGEKNYKKRFSKILEPLPNWVAKDSQIVTDLTVDKGTLNMMGFKYIIQATNNDVSSKNSNANIMDYLRRIVPRMFQNTLSLLSRQIIQQFLDELVWREWYGTSPGVTFDNIVSHISEQTRFDCKDTLVVRLSKVSANPFKNWAYTSNKSAMKNAPKDFKIEAVAPSTSASSSSISSGAPLTKIGRGRKRKEPSPEYQSTKNVSVKEESKHNSSTSAPAKKMIKTYFEKEEPKREKEPTIYIEQYYYGVINQEQSNESAIPVNFKVKCPLCDDVFSTNITLMNHLKYHANVNDDLQIQCLYCLENWNDDEKLYKHHVLAHPIDTKNLLSQGVVCIICETKFSTHSVLVNHMQKTHVPSDLPYRCGCCDYANSSLRYAIDHFYINHADSGILQCPFCLQIYVAVNQYGEVLSTNIMEYLNHLKIHINKSQCKKCNHCALSFTSKGALKVHQMYAHVSQANKSRRIQTVCKNTNKVPKPRTKHPYNREHVTYLSKYHNVLLFIDNGQLCLECNTDFEEHGHISGLMKCLKCKYHTCCLRTIMEHASLCDGGNNQEIAAFSTLDKEMHCICGFSSSEGNALARHLVTCERRSAYGSVELVQENTVKRNMLDMLGLVRRDEDEESDDLLLPANESDRVPAESEDEETLNEEADVAAAAATTTSNTANIAGAFDNENVEQQTENIEETAEEQIEEETTNMNESDVVEQNKSLAVLAPPIPTTTATEESHIQAQIDPSEQQQFITQLSLDDLAPPSIAPPPETDRTPQLRDEYQSLATPRVGPVGNENIEI